MYRQPRSGFTRVPYVEHCRVTIAGSERRGLLCNVSVLGAYLHIEPLPEIGATATLEFRLPDGGPMVTANVVVTWVNDAPPETVEQLPRGCGLRFTTLAPSDVRRLHALVSGFTGAPRPLHGRPEPQPEKVRIPFVGPCIVADARGARTAHICNLSRDGIYVAVDPIPELGEAVIVAFRLPGRLDAFERAAVVAWRNPEGPGRIRALAPGCGLRFANLSAADRALLVELVDRYAQALPAPAEEPT